MGFSSFAIYLSKVCAKSEGNDKLFCFILLKKNCKENLIQGIAE
jgi:hypothetical protein